MMRKSLCLGVLYVALFIGATQGEIFTSLADLENVLWAEKELASHLRGYIEQQEERINYLKRYGGGGGNSIKVEKIKL